VLHLTKSRISERLADARQGARVVELEEANALSRVELDTARSKLAVVEHRERTLTFENEGLKKYLENARTAYDAAVKDKPQVRKAERMKLHQFQDSVHKKLAEL
jgi:regulator of replication initiation timing